VNDPSPALLPTGRVEALSDGIIAIAATLLVLELHVPEPGEDVWPALATGSRRWPAALAVAAVVAGYFTLPPRRTDPTTGRTREPQ
jgi:uncharacterized membrane protein